MVCVCTYAQPDSVLNSQFAKRHLYVESLVQSSQKSGKASANKAIDDLIKGVTDEALLYHLRFAKISIDNSPDVKNKREDLIAIIEEAYNKGHILTAAYGYAKLSGEYKKQDRTKALELALNSFEIYQDVNIHDFPPRVDFQVQLAMEYYALGEYEKAKAYLLGLKNSDTTTLLLIMKYQYYKLALAYRENKQYDSAATCFKELYNYASINGASNIVSLSAGNLGSCYSLMQQYDSAIYWLNKELRLIEARRKGKYSRGQNELNTYVAIAEIYNIQNKVNNAKTYIDTATLIRQHLDNGLLINLKKYYEISGKIYHKQGLYELAYLYSDSALHAYQKKQIKTDKKYAYEAEQRFSDTRHNIEVLNIKHARQRAIWIRNFIILLIFLIALITVLIINRNRLRLRQKRLSLENQRNKAEADLLNFTIALKNKNEQLSALKEDVKKLSTETERIHKNELIAQLQNSTILTDKQWVDFKVIFEQVHNGYIDRVKVKYENITPAEIRYITLVKLGMTNREMANILGVNDSTVRNYKSRLRKKYDILNDDDFEEIISSI